MSCLNDGCCCSRHHDPIQRQEGRGGQGEDLSSPTFLLKGNKWSFPESLSTPSLRSHWPRRGYMSHLLVELRWKKQESGFPYSVVECRQRMRQRMALDGHPTVSAINTQSPLYSRAPGWWAAVLGTQQGPQRFVPRSTLQRKAKLPAFLSQWTSQCWGKYSSPGLTCRICYRNG